MTSHTWPMNLLDLILESMSFREYPFINTKIRNHSRTDKQSSIIIYLLSLVFSIDNNNWIQWNETKWNERFLRIWNLALFLQCFVSGSNNSLYHDWYTNITNRPHKKIIYNDKIFRKKLFASDFFNFVRHSIRISSKFRF